MGLSQILAKGLPGNLVESHRAGYPPYFQNFKNFLIERKSFEKKLPDGLGHGGKGLTGGGGGAGGTWVGYVGP